jgi:glycosyltransferase involved in cell wall biosynthesis
VSTSAPVPDGASSEQPLVSVVVPTYNRTAYLETALASAVRQTYANIEILVADDASKEDVFGAVVSKFAGDPRIKYQRNPQNLGMGINTWQALTRASGKYVANLHDDDAWEPEFLAALVPPLERDDSLSVAFCDHHVVDQHGTLDPAASDANMRRWHRDRLGRGPLRPFTEAAVLWQAVPAAMAAVFRKSAIDWNDFPPEVGTYYDIWLAYQSARHGAGAFYDPRRLTRYRVHGQSETRSWSFAAGKVKAMRQAEFVFRRYLEDPDFRDLRGVIEREYARKVISLAEGLIAVGEVAEARRLLAQVEGRVSRPEIKAMSLAVRLPPAVFRGIVAASRRVRALLPSGR